MRLSGQLEAFFCTKGNLITKLKPLRDGGSQNTFIWSHHISRSCWRWANCTHLKLEESKVISRSVISVLGSIYLKIMYYFTLFSILSIFITHTHEKHCLVDNECSFPFPCLRAVLFLKCQKLSLSCLVYRMTWFQLEYLWISVSCFKQINSS